MVKEILKEKHLEICGGTVKKFILRPAVLCLFIILLVTGIYGIYTYDKTFPLAEGWYSVYAKMVKEGKIPYKDFELLYTPFYLYIITFITFVFGENIIILRITGIILFMLLALVSYYIYKLLFNSYISTICSLITVFIMQSEVVQIFYDYIRFYDLFNYIGILLFMYFIKNGKEGPKKNLQVILAGMFFSLSFLVRQSSGIINSAAAIFIIAVLMLIYKTYRKSVKHMLFFGAGFALPLLILAAYLISNGSFNSFLKMVFTDASESKGGLITILFTWIPNLFANGWYIIAGLILLAAICAALYFLYKANDKKYFLYNKNYIFIFFALTVTAMALTAVFYQAALPFAPVPVWGLVNILFFVNIILMFFFFVKFYRVYKSGNEAFYNYLKYFTLSFFIFGTAYGSGTSGGLSEGQAALSYGFISGIILLLVFSLERHRLYKAAVLALSFLLIVCGASRKIIYPYNWWGLTEPAYYRATEYIDIGILKGIRVSSGTKFILEDITSKIKNGTVEGESIYCFPQVTIFYLTAGIMPKVFSVIPWFDVSSDESVYNDLQNLKHEKPRFIVVADCGEYVINEHEQRFRSDKKSSQRLVYEWIDLQESLGVYTVAGEYFVSDGETDSVHFPEYKIYLYELSD